MDATEQLRRAALAMPAVAVVAALLVYALHAPFHGEFLPWLGLSPRLGDALGVLFSVLAACLILALLVGFYRRVAPADAVRRQVVAELQEVSRFNAIVSGQLQHVIGETERSAFDITSRLQAIDEAVGDPDGTARFSAMLMEAIASVQFQDLTRQQLEQVIGALGQLEAHLAELARRLAQDGAAHAELKPLAAHMDEMYGNYVMDAQRQAHGAAASAPAGVAAGAAGPRIELF